MRSRRSPRRGHPILTSTRSYISVLSEEAMLWRTAGVVYRPLLQEVVCRFTVEQPSASPPELLLPWPTRADAAPAVQDPSPCASVRMSFLPAASAGWWHRPTGSEGSRFTEDRQARGSTIGSC